MSLYHTVSIGTCNIAGNLFLAPVSGWTDGVFRTICAEHGADCTTTELVSAESIVRNIGRTAPLLERTHSEKPCAIQLFGSEPSVLYRAVSFLEAFRPDMLDLNAGCPVDKVVKTGAGSALMRQPILLGRCIEALVRGSHDFLHGIPVTVKMRSGWDSTHINYRECGKIAQEAGAALITLHPRTRVQQYSGTSNWEHITTLVSECTVPITGSGDLFSPADAQRMLEETACAAVMFARGALGNPFIFKETQSLLAGHTVHSPDIPSIVDIALRHVEQLAAVHGELPACKKMRRHFCAYTKGFHGAAALRTQIVHIQTLEEYRELFKKNQDQ
ncbi:putative tRNA-dihydrouridine synthase [Pillotina sp. SPG140]|jgi:nifR3 family TIM-barrel protein